MSFSEKIDKILKDNKLGINSPSALERYLKVGVGSINAHYRAGTVPGLKILKKIEELPGLNLMWWNTGKGDPFETKLTLISKSDETKQDYPQMMDKLFDLLEYKEKEIKDLKQQLADCLRKADHP